VCVNWNWRTHHHGDVGRALGSVDDKDLESTGTCRTGDKEMTRIVSKAR